MLLVYRKNLNLVIDNVNQLTQIVNNIDDNFNDIYQKITQIIILIEDINFKFVEFENKINRDTQLQLQQFNNQILSLLNDYQTIFNGNLQNMYDDLSAQITSIELGNVDAYNPTNR